MAVVVGRGRGSVQQSHINSRRGMCACLAKTMCTGVQFNQKVRERFWVKEMKRKTLRFLVNECLCQVSCLGKSGGFGTCQTNSLVIITPTSKSSISTGIWSAG